ncbi:hypothetical protein D8I24_0002 (plasmid) [Cupriavidus necator H850]|nr:hypothetical protein D8I24_0002 [Cupriavidus necator H850]
MLTWCHPPVRRLLFVYPQIDNKHSSLMKSVCLDTQKLPVATRLHGQLLHEWSSIPLLPK